MNLDFFLFQQINPIKDFFSLLTSLDTGIFNRVNSLAGKYLWLDTIAIFFAQYLGYFLIFFLFLFLAKNFKKYRSMIVRVFGAVILARLVITETIRYFFPIFRPFLENNVNLLLNYPATASFPSGHAAFYFSLATVIYFYNKKAGFLFFFASFLISISRVFIGIHWPSDILAGLFVGIFSGWLVIKLTLK